jgi:hypothetical protein
VLEDDVVTQDSNIVAGNGFSHSAEVLPLPNQEIEKHKLTTIFALFTLGLCLPGIGLNSILFRKYLRSVCIYPYTFPNEVAALGL